MPTVDVSQTYSDNNPLTQAQLDAMATSIETALNVTKLDQDNIAAGGIATANIANLAVTAGKMANATITETQISSNVNLPGKLTTAAGQAIVVSANPDTYGLMILRGVIDSSGSTTVGEGFTSSKTATGKYTITFTAAFTEAPAVTVTSHHATLAYGASITAVSTSAVSFLIFDGASGTAQDTSFSFIAIGERI